MYSIKITWAAGTENEFVLKAKAGEVLLQALLNNNIAIRHDCGGICSCATCQVYITKGMAAFEAPTRREEDFLTKKAVAATSALRLSCQCVLKNESGVIQLIIPNQTSIPSTNRLTL